MHPGRSQALLESRRRGIRHGRGHPDSQKAAVLAPSSPCVFDLRSIYSRQRFSEISPARSRSTRGRLAGIGLCPAIWPRRKSNPRSSRTSAFWSTAALAWISRCCRRPGEYRASRAVHDPLPTQFGSIREGEPIGVGGLQGGEGTVQLLPRRRGNAIGP